MIYYTDNKNVFSTHLTLMENKDKSIDLIKNNLICNHLFIQSSNAKNILMIEMYNYMLQI